MTTPTEPTTGNGQRNQNLQRIALIVLPALAVLAAAYYFAAVRPYETTDDAFIDGQVIQISPRVSGHVMQLLIADNQHVKKGDLLVQIDSRDHEVKLEAAQANLAAARSRQAQAQILVTVAEATAAQDRAAVVAAAAEARRAQTDLERYRAIESRAISQQQLDAVVATAQATGAALEVAQKRTAVSEAQIGLAKSQIAIAETGVEQAVVAVRQAELDLSYTKIFAPVDGWVTHRAVEVGQLLQPGQGLLAIVAEHEWVTANFKETQLAQMKPGQPVSIKVDAFSDRRFNGHVDSIQAGTGSQFSLLPPENAAGNYVKVVQRVPVKILFDETDVPRFPLGASVVPVVKVR